MAQLKKKFACADFFRTALFMAIFCVLSAFGKTEVPVFLLSGQSNMGSRADTSGLSGEQRKMVDNVKIHLGGGCDPTKRGRWLTLGPGFGRYDMCSGMELFFGRTLADSMPGKKMAFIKNAVDGAPLGRPTGFMSPGSNGGAPGSLYKDLMTDIDTAMQSFWTAFDTSLYSPKWAGFVWLQGETDAMVDTLANAYETNLGNLIKDIRAKCLAPDLPVILPLITTQDIWTFNSQIRAADVVMKRTLKNVDTMETKDFGLSDGRHYEVAGQIQIGIVSARRWLAMHYGYTPTDRVLTITATPSGVRSIPHFAVFDLLGRKIPVACDPSRFQAPSQRVFIWKGQTGEGRHEARVDVVR